MPEADDPLPLFVPNAADQLREGWQLHVARRRLIHEQAARNAQRAHYIVGSIATLLASFAGSSLVTSWSTDESNSALAIIGGAAGAIAAMLIAFQTFLDLGGRAERHRQAANDYKALLRRFERMAEKRGATPICGRTTDEEVCGWLEDIQQSLLEVDSKAPVVPAKLAENIERRPPHPATTADQIVAGPSDHGTEPAAPTSTSND